MKNRFISLFISCFLYCSWGASGVYSQDISEKVIPVPFSKIRITDHFWNPKMKINREVSLPHCFLKARETGIHDNFEIASGAKHGKFRGVFFSDAQVYKNIEAASFILHTHYDPELDSLLDSLIRKIAAAQEEDGYINSKYTIDGNRLSKPGTNLELYCIGHLMEAAYAHFLATGKRTLLDVAIKAADFVAGRYGENKIRDVPGHEEIEVGLMKIYEITDDEKYFNLCKFFIDERGHPNTRELMGPFHQDHKPFIEQTEAVGQAPRATYLYAGAADVARYNKDEKYINALNALWDDVVYKKMYITGGIGSRHENEGFGEPYDLPNLTAYTEICAAISFSMWNHRMFLLHTDSKYIDVLERTIYNNFLAGVSLAGDRFFYACPPESDGKYAFNQGWTNNFDLGMYREASVTRKDWFFCPCCPPNLIRYLPVIPQFMYAISGTNVYVNLFIDSETTFNLNGIPVSLIQETRYPWDGQIKITVNPDENKEFSVLVRIPWWSQGKPAPGDLYSYLEEPVEKPVLRLNGTEQDIHLKAGYAELHKTWTKGDIIELDLPMTVNRVVSHEKVLQNRKKIAVERGPLVYCAEWFDNRGSVLDIMLDDNAELIFSFDKDMLGGIGTISGQGFKQGNLSEHNLVLIPYYTWSNRGSGEMAVWLRFIRR